MTKSGEYTIFTATRAWREQGLPVSEDSRISSPPLGTYLGISLGSAEGDRGEQGFEEALTFDPPIGMGASADDTRKVLGGNLARLLGL